MSSSCLPSVSFNWRIMPLPQPRFPFAFALCHRPYFYLNLFRLPTYLLCRLYPPPPLLTYSPATSPFCYSPLYPPPSAFSALCIPSYTILFAYRVNHNGCVFSFGLLRCCRVAWRFSARILSYVGGGNTPFSAALARGMALLVHAARIVWWACASRFTFNAAHFPTWHDGVDELRMAVKQKFVFVVDDMAHLQRHLALTAATFAYRRGVPAIIINEKRARERARSPPCARAFLYCCRLVCLNDGAGGTFNSAVTGARVADGWFVYMDDGVATT